MTPTELDRTIKAHIRESKNTLDDTKGAEGNYHWLYTRAIVWILSAIAWALVDIARAIRGK